MKNPTAIQYFSKRAGSYELSDGGNAARTAEFYKHALGELNIVVPAGKLLDVGIATGLLSAPFAKDGFEIYGVDGSKKMLDACIAKGIKAENLKQLNLTQKPLPFDGDSFDIVVTSSTLFYLNNACDVVREMIRVAKPDGIIMMDPEIHNADSDAVLNYELAEGRPRYFIVSDRLLNEIFDEAGVTVLEKKAYAVHEQESPKLGKFQVANSLMVLRKQPA
jgi:ubiquinone/menaquinone biosynthesis C-methylase UbiE